MFDIKLIIILSQTIWCSITRQSHQCLLNVDISVLMDTPVQYSNSDYEEYSLAHTLLLNIFYALKGTRFYILFFVTAAGVVLCGSPKKQPRTSSIVQFIFFSFGPLRSADIF